MTQLHGAGRCQTRSMAASLYASSPVAEIVFAASMAAFVAGEVQQTVRARRRGTLSNPRDELVFRALFALGVLALPVGLALVPAADFGGVVAFVLGMVVLWAGIALRWWSFTTLGGLFTMVVQVSPGQRIVDRGPYRFVRHPSYTGLILAVLGCGVVLGNWAGVLLAVTLITAALVYRLLREERALSAASGAAYRDFARGRARLVPHVW